MDSSEDSENEVVNLSIMAKSYESDEEVSLKKSCYIDSRCSKHMTENIVKILLREGFVENVRKHRENDKYFLV